MVNIEELLNESAYTKARTFDKIILHLQEAVKDPRPRERVRAQIALKNISEWVENVRRA